MKKSLLLFVLFLGLNVGAFANGEIAAPSQVELTEARPTEDGPTWIFIKWNDGTTTTIDNGSPCVDVYGESDSGMLDHLGSVGC